MLAATTWNFVNNIQDALSQTTNLIINTND